MYPTAAIQKPNRTEMASDSPGKIRELLGATEEGASALHATINQLEERLSTVLTPAPPQGLGDSSKTQPPEPLMSNVQQRVRVVNLGFSHAIDRLSDIIRRIEV